MRYVNVTGGAKTGSGDAQLARAMEWLAGAGFAAYANVVPGPLIRATNGNKLTHMPYSPGSTHVHLVPAMIKAHERVKASGQADPEYDETTDPDPKFGNHSNRRHADRVALRNAAKTGATKDDINFFFGWKLKKMAEDMRLHYASLDRLLRLQMSQVTAWM